VTSTQDQRNVLLCVLAVCAGTHVRRRRCVSVVRTVSLPHCRVLQLERARRLSPALSTCLAELLLTLATTRTCLLQVNKIVPTCPEKVGRKSSRRTVCACCSDMVACCSDVAGWVLALVRRAPKREPPLMAAREDAAAAVEDKAETINEQLVVAAKRGDPTQVESLLMQGADKNHAMYGGQDASALAWASQFGHLKCVEILLAAGADVAAIDDAYFTPLELAIIGGHHAVMQALLQPSVDSINQTDGVSTILHFLATNGCLKGVKLCLEAGARPNGVDDEGRAAWEWANDEGHTEIVRLLKPVRGVDALRAELQHEPGMTVRLDVLAREVEDDVEAIAMFAAKVGGFEETPAEADDATGAYSLNDGLCIHKSGEASVALARTALTRMIQTGMQSDTVVLQTPERAAELADEVLAWFEPTELRLCLREGWPGNPGNFVWASTAFEDGLLLLDDTRIGMVIFQEED